jgi:hypothetical protein
MSKHTVTRYLYHAVWTGVVDVVLLHVLDVGIVVTIAGTMHPIFACGTLHPEVRVSFLIL